LGVIGFATRARKASPEQRYPRTSDGVADLLAPPPVEPPGPTPWATGLVIAAFVAVFLTLADVALCRAFAEAFGLLWIPANLLVGLGLAPSLWLLRHTPLWRWLALGSTVGLGVSWIVLLLAMLGPS
jgi:Protein of unknown function (DUF2537)